MSVACDISVQHSVFTNSPCDIMRKPTDYDRAYAALFPSDQHWIDFRDMHSLPHPGWSIIIVNKINTASCALSFDPAISRGWIHPTHFTNGVINLPEHASECRMAAFTMILFMHGYPVTYGASAPAQQGLARYLAQRDYLGAPRPIY